MNAKQSGNPKTFRLSDDGSELLGKLAKKKGVTLTAVVELAVRDMAERENVRLSDDGVGAATNAPHPATP